MGKHSRDETSDERKKQRKRQRKEAKKARHPTQHRPHQSIVFFQKQVEVTVSILPFGLRDLRKSVNDSLRLWLLRYSSGLGGILLSFSNVQVLTDGKIMNDLPHIHYQVSCDMLVFDPLVGTDLNGVVTESFHSHISLLVFGYFNASIPVVCLKDAGFEFDGEHWKLGGTPVALGENVHFRVNKVYESGGIVSIEGSQPIGLHSTSS